MGIICKVWPREVIKSWQCVYELLVPLRRQHPKCLNYYVSNSRNLLKTCPLPTTLPTSTLILTSQCLFYWVLCVSIKLLKQQTQSDLQPQICLVSLYSVYFSAWHLQDKCEAHADTSQTTFCSPLLALADWGIYFMEKLNFLFVIVRHEAFKEKKCEQWNKSWLLLGFGYNIYYFFSHNILKSHLHPQYIYDENNVLDHH